MMKKVWIGLGVALLLVVVILVLVMKNLDPIIKSVVERVGSEVTGTAVTLGGVETDLKAGRATLRALSVANPEGYSEGPMFSVDELSAAVDFKSGAIRDVQIVAPYIYAEQRGAQNNFKAVQEYMAASSTKDESAAPAEEAPAPAEPAEDAAPVHLQIDNFDLTDAEVAYQVVDTAQTGQVTLARISFTGLEGTPEEVVKQVIGQLTGQVVSGVLTGIAEKGKEALQAHVDARAEEARQELEEKLDEKRDEVSEKVEEALGGLKGILNRGRDAGSGNTEKP